MPRFDVLPRNPIATLNPAPTAQANTTQQPLNPALEGVRPGDTGPIEGRPPGPIWAHQEFTRFPPAIAVPVSTEGAKVNTVYNPGVPSSLNSGINAATPFPPRFHPNLPDQGPLALWTFNGTLPPKLLVGRYGEGIIFRHSNKLPFDIRQNGGFGIHTLSTHEHNGTMARRTTASPGLSSTPASSTTTTIPSSWRGGGPSTPAPRMRGPGAPTAQAASPRFRATGKRR